MESSETDHSDWDRADGTAGKSHSRKELLETKVREMEKTLLEKIGEKEAQLAGKDETQLRTDISQWSAKKAQLEQAQQEAKKLFDKVKNHLTEVHAAIAAIRSLEEAAETEDTLPSETELQEKIAELTEQKQKIDQKHSEQYHAANTNRATYRQCRISRARCRQWKRSTNGYAHSLIRLAALLAESGKSNSRRTFRWPILTGFCEKPISAS